MTPEYIDLLGVPPQDYILAAWEKLNQQTIGLENFNFYLSERIGNDAIKLTGDVYVATKKPAKNPWKPSGEHKIEVVITSREVFEYVAKKTAPPVDQEEAVRRIQAKAELLIAEANELGVVLTVENRPVFPLAMGRSELVLDVRPRRR